jgi:dihydropteroate synthase-like protein
MTRERILFVTGRLAEASLRRVLAQLAPQAGFDYEVAVLGISVAALMHAEWVNRKLQLDSPVDRVILPGWCQGDLRPLAERFRTPFELGPKELFDLPKYFGNKDRPVPDFSQFSIEILAEINHAPRLTDAEILRAAQSYRASGANVIDLGCVPGESWPRAGEVARLLRAEEFRISIDSFDRAEVESSVAAGAELVLSCNSSNLDWAAELDAELVAIPDDPHNLATLERTVDALRQRGARFRVDPILEPIGFGFARSLARYFDVRRQWPEMPMMMGIGNLTELTEVDSAGVNLMLAAICQELGIRSVLTTEVINWARSAVAEFDFARRLVHYSLSHQVLPKHVDSRLVMLRDPQVREWGEAELARLASQLTDPNFRIFVEHGELHLMNRDGYWHGSDPYELFDRAVADSGIVLDPSHAFYLGYELSKARTAVTLGKQYTQDEALQWGLLTIPEVSAHARRKQERQQPP